ncbi:MAG: hypothetical protein AVDCRST_MAG27-696 [uncultured Craurococcus sp.]|uniref:Uncharacterized protein n=1 Tax=uncultured Craurococcus sp. TaxID=1135998 RepID=A0A6J4HJ70_9PROT|nr:MAG: hypothetical protein AVDCRST_MAG27-696 [uncultured Craurococcus sp.]
MPDLAARRAGPRATGRGRAPAPIPAARPDPGGRSPGTAGCAARPGRRAVVQHLGPQQPACRLPGEPQPHLAATAEGDRSVQQAAEDLAQPPLIGAEARRQGLGPAERAVGRRAHLMAGGAERPAPGLAGRRRRIAGSDQLALLGRQALGIRATCAASAASSGAEQGPDRRRLGGGEGLPNRTVDQGGSGLVETGGSGLVAGGEAAFAVGRAAGVAERPDQVGRVGRLGQAGHVQGGDCPEAGGIRRREPIEASFVGPRHPRAGAAEGLEFIVGQDGMPQIGKARLPTQSPEYSIHHFPARSPLSRLGHAISIQHW